jgi:hypothetical protein
MRKQKAKRFSQACQIFCSQDVPFCVAEEKQSGGDTRVLRHLKQKRYGNKRNSGKAMIPF